MDEINDKLSKILDDPESMEKVRRMAESILGEEDEGPLEQTGDLALDPALLSKIAGIMQRLKGGADNRTALLVALKPLVSPRRQKRVETAVKLLRLIDLLPYLKDSGLLDIL